MGQVKDAFMEDIDNYGDVVEDAFVEFQSVENQKKFKQQLLDAKLKGLNVHEGDMRENYIATICEKLSPNANINFSWSHLVEEFFWNPNRKDQ